MSVESEIYTSYEAIPNEVIAKWRERKNLTFDQTPEWHRLLYQYVLKGSFSEKFVVMRSENSGLPLAVAPLALTNRPVLPLGIKCLRSHSNYYSSSYELIPLAGEIREAIFESFCSAMENIHTDARFIELEPMPREGHSFKKLSQYLIEQKFILVPYRRFSNWYHLSGGQSFQEYLGSREGRIRNTFKRKEKRLRKEGYEVEIVRNIAGVSEALDEYEAVYDASWKIGESHPEFIRALCTSFAAKGLLRLGVLRTSEGPLAAQIWFVKDGVASIFKLSYAERFRSLSAGTVLTMALIKYVLEVDRVNKIDYLTGDDAYKKNYMNSSREMWCLRAYKRRSMAGIFGRYEYAKEALRRRLKKDEG